MTDNKVADVTGIGFGPSNLALATALAEPAPPGPGRPLKAVFFERKERFSWHAGMLLDGATMQISFLKDLVTLRDPRSPYSFLNYLHHADRLSDFINHKLLFPSRVEFHDYLAWVAGFFEEQVTYGSEVVDVRPVSHGDAVEHMDVVVRQRTAAGERTVVQRTRNLVVATGLEPYLPPGTLRSEHVWHTSELLHRVEQLPSAPRRIVVVGAGQSAAEAAEFLHTRFASAEVCAVFSRYGYSPSDDSPFANRIFDPAAVDDYCAAAPETRRMLLDYHRNTNYSVVDPELIDELYRRVYQEKVRGRPRLNILGASRLASVEPAGEGVDVTVESLVSREHTTMRADCVVYATGYRPADVRGLLGSMAGLCKADELGRVEADRQYRAVTEGDVHCGIYLQGATEHSHGISSSLLSNTAVRAGEIADAVRADAAAMRGCDVRT
ncbi:lysine N(6)-hydroxylase/L-ornithine N(5)-oxygenase family protein [Streptomyces sp. Rer75]|uniref:lysine N(6)-hydroxylase/L-ornithine N(5)-oxygenase family protein n=1 Tax=Streptomyces sp. Rer75 TaxID=2750011 RepID=UPI0015D0A818|nr:lysine N(6)-hydroxylase/L-ornithine N(5)-oxygenase family protein [Streptomyces sp. Rer75]QLH25620.1 lysine N(6)-hydroxylase/L-ornithine N(5)-oxygenase family protein [Streptomyces sp. Rer75]